ncbi:MAG TPA: hypothetical protein VH325_12135 [Bryobacteraceae bacterium]|jgi:hypothetical protein|nr:hypothetical protein [Bryobacteraceae bacterium]
MPTQDTEAIGRIYRHQKSDRQALAYIDAELSEAANNFRTAACQLENLLANARSNVGPALANIDMAAVLRALANREVLQRKLANSQAALRKFNAQH